jgi:hypothetical protein
MESRKKEVQHKSKAKGNAEMMERSSMIKELQYTWRKGQDGNWEVHIVPIEKELVSDNCHLE